MKDYGNNKYIKRSSLRKKESVYTPRKSPIKNMLEKRAFLFAFELKASLTVEAAMILPVFLFAMCFMLYFMNIIRVSTQVNTAVYNAGRQLSLYAYAQENNAPQVLSSDLASYGIGNAYVLSSIKKELGDDYFDKAGIKGGALGINLGFSKYSGDYIDILAIYHMDMPFYPAGGDKDIKLVSKCRMRKWTGYNPSDKMSENELMVYITPYGDVYHMSSACSHINLSIKEKSRNEIKSLRNTGGEKYYECNICKGSSDRVYITDSGNKYHTNPRCSGIKRTIFKVPLSTAGSMKRCTRCGG